jgi:hypothetical protein
MNRKHLRFDASQPLTRRRSWTTTRVRQQRRLHVEQCETRVLLDGSGVTNGVLNPNGAPVIYTHPSQESALVVSLVEKAKSIHGDLITLVESENSSLYDATTGDFKIDNSIPFDTFRLTMFPSGSSEGFQVPIADLLNTAAPNDESLFFLDGLSPFDTNLRGTGFGNDSGALNLTASDTTNNFNSFETQPSASQDSIASQIIEQSPAEPNPELSHHSESSIPLNMGLSGPRLLNPQSATSNFDSAFFRLGASSPSWNGSGSVNHPLENLSLNFPSNTASGALTVPELSSSLDSTWSKNASVDTSASLGNHSNAPPTASTDAVQAATEPTDAVIAEHSIRVQALSPNTNQREIADIDIARLVYGYESSGRLKRSATASIQLATAKGRTSSPTTSHNNSNANRLELAQRTLSPREAEPRRGVVRSLEISSGPERALARRSIAPSPQAALELTQKLSPARRLQSQLEWEDLQVTLKQNAKLRTNDQAAVSEDSVVPEQTLSLPDSEQSWNDSWTWLSEHAAALPEKLARWLPHTSVVMVVSLSALVFAPREKAPESTDSPLSSHKSGSPKREE